jgi:NAD(P)-dependent dehydrogenase (short-subunit alcohol dehydrogenase family)
MMKTLKEMMNLSGRRAAVSGAAGQIGAACTEGLIELGATVALLDKDPAACEDCAARLGPNALAIPCDLSDEQSTRSAVNEAIQKLGGLDILVHCAAFVGTTQIPGWAVPFEEQTVEAWDKAMRVNVTAAFVMAQQARNALKNSGHGSIVLFGSIYGMVGPDLTLYAGTTMANPAGYGASKGGLNQLMRYLATVLAPEIRVNAVTPGGVARGQPDVFQQRYDARTPLKRMATEEDMKGAVAYLASDLSAYVTGHNLVIDGGWTAW